MNAVIMIYDHVYVRCLVNSAQNQLGPILTWPKTNSAQMNNQLGPRYVPTLGPNMKVSEKAPNDRFLAKYDFYHC